MSSLIRTFRRILHSWILPNELGKIFGLALGSPVRYNSPASHLKAQITGARARHTLPGLALFMAEDMTHKKCSEEPIATPSRWHPIKSKTDLTEYLPLIAKLAWSAWHHLPKQVRTWISVEDLIHDGWGFAYYYVQQRWDSSRHTKFSTFLYGKLWQHYDSYYIQPHFTKRHNEQLTIGLEDIRSLIKNEDTSTMEPSTALARLARSSVHLIEPSVECGVVDNLLSIYESGSPDLQQAITRWFLKPLPGNLDDRTFNTPEFRRRAKEFRFWAQNYQLHRQDCEHLLQSLPCLDLMSRRLCSVPYDLNYPTPGLRGY